MLLSTPSVAGGGVEGGGIDGIGGGATVSGAPGGGGCGGIGGGFCGVNDPGNAGGIVWLEGPGNGPLGVKAIIVLVGTGRAVIGPSDGDAISGGPALN